MRQLRNNLSKLCINVTLRLDQGGVVVSCIGIAFFGIATLLLQVNEIEATTCFY